MAQRLQKTPLIQFMVEPRKKYYRIQTDDHISKSKAQEKTKCKALYCLENNAPFWIFKLSYNSPKEGFGLSNII